MRAAGEHQLDCCFQLPRHLVLLYPSLPPSLPHSGFLFLSLGFYLSTPCRPCLSLFPSRSSLLLISVFQNISLLPLSTASASHLILSLSFSLSRSLSLSSTRLYLPIFWDGAPAACPEPCLNSAGISRLLSISDQQRRSGFRAGRNSPILSRAAD